MKYNSLKYYLCTTNKRKTYHDCHKNRLKSGETRKDSSQNGRRGIEGRPRSRAFFGIAAVQTVCMCKDPRPGPVCASLFHLKNNDLLAGSFYILEEEIFFRSSRFIICKSRTLTIKKLNL